MKRKPRLLFVALALMASTLALPAPMASAAAGDHSITVTGTADFEPGESAQPFAGAVVSGAGDLEGVSIYIETGHDPAVDLLAVGTLPAGISEAYDATKGLLRLRGAASPADYQMAIRSISYSQTSATEGARTFLLIAGPVLYLEETGNLYQFVDEGASITWTAARTAATAATFGASPGHLVNISSQAENDIAVVEIQGNTWIGATDEAVEDTWVWADGPEAGQEFWSGLGSGAGGTPTAGLYSNWADGEPNQFGGGEDYAHMFAGVGNWNDYPHDSNVEGYLVEYEVADIGTIVSRVTSTIATPPPPPVCVRTLTGNYANASGVEGEIGRLYMATFLRQPDASGFAYWVAQANSGYSVWNIAGHFADSPEFDTTYDSLADADFLELMYENVMCRPSDSEGKAYWLGLLTSDSLDRAGVLHMFADSPEFHIRTVTS